MQQKWEVQNLGMREGEGPSVSSLVGNPDLPIKNTLGSVPGVLTALVLKKWERVFSFKWSNLQNLSLIMENDSGQSAEDFPSFSK